MNWADLNLIPAMPEIVLLVALCVVLLVDVLFSHKAKWVAYGLSLVTLVVVAGFQVKAGDVIPTMTFSDMFVSDSLSQVAKFAMYIATFFLFIYSRPYLQSRDMYQGEFYTLSLFSLLGMAIMVSSNHFLVLYIGLELMSLALYAMIALRRDHPQASEAAFKYFVLGALSSGLLLYGMSLIYGGTGSLYLTDMVAGLSNGTANATLTQFGLVFVVVGLAFKLGTVPFHMWVPDVYEGAPTIMGAFLGAAPKVASVIFMFRILVMGLSPLADQWVPMLNLLAIASLLVGNLSAIMQTNVKRMLAYSTISHMGFVVLGFMGDLLGYQAAMIYTLTYVVMSVAAFGVLMILSTKERDCEQLSDLAGLNQTHPWLAFLMLLTMFSMAGIPPLLGFYAKFAIIQALLSQGYLWVSVFAVIMSLIGAFYYLRVVKVMYFDQPAKDMGKVSMSWEVKLFLSINALALLALGIMPDALVAWSTQAFQFLL